MKLIFLGTSAMIPTRERGHFSVLLSYEAENILIDAGENIQRQLRFADISPTKITRILLTHLHGDHILGLPGLLQTLIANEFTKTLEVYGPKGTKKFIDDLVKLFVHKLTFNLKIKEINKDLIIKNKDFQIYSFPLKHTTNCLAYRFIENDKRKINLDYTKKFGLERHPLLGNLQKGKDIIYKGKKITVEKGTILKKGKVISFILDTELCNNCYKAAENADLLICEATYSNELKEKAKEYKHLTAKDAALVAKKSKVKKLILTHFSQRYHKNISSIEKEAKKIFKNTICSEDLMEIEL